VGAQHRPLMNRLSNKQDHTHINNITYIHAHRSGTWGRNINLSGIAMDGSGNYHAVPTTNPNAPHGIEGLDTQNLRISSTPQGHVAAVDATGNLTRVDATGNLNRVDATGNLNRVDATGNLNRVDATGNVTRVDATGNLNRVDATGNVTRVDATAMRQAKEFVVAPHVTGSPWRLLYVYVCWYMRMHGV
jgi:hypothetical protein